MSNDMQQENINKVATDMAATLGKFVNDDQISPPEIVVGAVRASIVFWMGCIQDGARVDALDALRQGMNEEIDNMVRGIANGLVPA
jgi:CheY-specific phosphatase CheX